MATPKDKELYEKVKKEVYGRYKTHSAYRSLYLSKEYKKQYEAKHKSKDAYEGKKQLNKGLNAWLKQKWQTQEGKTTYQKKGDIFRPTVISGKTPILLQQLTKQQIEKAQQIKAKTGRVMNFAKL
jgi:hypothetical protein